MLNSALAELIKKELGHRPTECQKLLISELAEYIISKKPDRTFIIKGFAGTGKTTVLGALVRTLDKLELKNILLAPTGRAAKVFSSYAGKSAYTIHKKIYIKKSSGDAFGKFVLSTNLHRNTLFLVDEASMIANTMTDESVFGSGRLLDDLIKYVKSGDNCRLVFIGDTAQLPPVGTSLSPALSPSDMTLYYTEVADITLTDVVRQAEDSGILVNATIVRNILSSGSLKIPVLINQNQGSVYSVPASEISEEIERSYSKYGQEDTIVLCRSNKRANQFNSGIRSRVLYFDEEINPGELLMVVRNNYFWLAENPDYDFIANGDIVKVLRITKHTERYGFRFAFVRLLLIDQDIEFESWILLDTLTSESAALSQIEYRKLFEGIIEDYREAGSKKEKMEAVREDPFFNALQVKYSYAVTCHKAQGGQWKSVFIDQGYIKKEMIDRDYLRWLYTAITRATECLCLVNFPDFMLGTEF